MSDQVKPIPDGYHTLTPYLNVRGAANAIDFYAKAFGARERARMPGPGDSVMHAELEIGDSVVMLADENPAAGAQSPQSLNGASSSLLIYSADVDKAHQQAVDAGCTSDMPPTDMFWGDRFCRLTDPFGHQWSISTHIEDVGPEEMGKRAAAMAAEMAGG